MKHEYSITGMTCNSCVAKVKNELLKMGDIESAEVQLQSPQATITMSKHIPIASLQQAIGKAGNYNVTEADGGMKRGMSNTAEETGSASACCSLSRRELGPSCKPSPPIAR